MGSLGSFGAAVKELDPDAERDTFDFFGQEFTVEGIIPPMLMLQLGASSSGKIDESDGLAAIWETMRCCLTKPERVVAEFDPETRKPKVEPADASQFEKFYRLAVDERDELDDLIRLAMALFQAQAGRPTGQRSTSPGGPLPTSTSSNGSSATPPDSLGSFPVGAVSAG